MNSNKVKNRKGITLIALIITIIVMLILVAVTISMAINGGLFYYAGKAVGETQDAIDVEQQLADGKIQIDGVWYDSIDDYIAGKPSSENGGEEDGEEGSIQIELSIVGEKVTTVPLPSSDFEHVEGTIDTGYVIRHKTDENEFVWVPVDKNQKITLKVTSEKDVTDLKLYDPCGDAILTVEDGNVQTTYNNTEIAPTYNGMYMAVATTEDGVTQKTLTVKSLYALDTMNDWYTTDEYAVTQGAANKEQYVLAMLTQLGFSKVEDALAYFGYPTIDVAMSAFISTDQYMNWKAYQDTEDHKADVEKNGGFYIARYEAGTSAENPRTSGDINAEVSAIKTANGVPVSKEGYAPYNWVTHSQALGLAKSMYAENNVYEVSLITGSGWDRTLGWFQETGRKSAKEIAEGGGDSTSWGNYFNAEFEITKGKYSTNYGSSYTEVSGTYTKPENEEVLLTTGATTRNSENNIFDLAGNVLEWTNESYSSDFRVNRGGNYDYYGAGSPAGDRSYDGLDTYDYSIGFRPALYLK